MASRVVKEQSGEIAAGMAALCDAVGHLRTFRNALERASRTEAPGGRLDRITLGMERACAHLVEAIADLPDECWAELLSDRQVSEIELRKGLEVKAA